MPDHRRSASVLHGGTVALHHDPPVLHRSSEVGASMTVADYTPEEAAYWASHFSALDESKDARDRPEDIHAEAGSDLSQEAMKEAEGYSFWFYPSKVHAPWLSRVLHVEEKRQAVMALHREWRCRTEWWETQLLTVVHGPNHSEEFPEFDEHDPEHARGVFLVVEVVEHTLHVLKPTIYTVEDALATLLRDRNSCRWDGPECAEYANDFLLLSQGQYLVAVPTCLACRDWLVKGCPGGEFPTPSRASR